MKIILLTNGIFPFVIGGMQKHSYYLSKYFAKNQFFVDLLHPGGKTGEEININNFFSVEELKYINFIEIPFPSLMRFPGHYIFSSYFYSKKLFEHVSFSGTNNIIYAQGFTSWYFLKKKPFQQNLITNLHGLEMFQYGINFKNKLKQILLKIPAKLIIKSSKNQISLGGKLTGILKSQKAINDSIFIIPNAIEHNFLRHESNIKKSAYLKFVFIGRYERRKGIEELIMVLNKLIFNYDFEFHFIGEINHLKKINHKNIIYHGIIEDQKKIKLILDNSDILVCPSYSEGMPTVILEAMAARCAIIATDVGAVSELLDDKNGWLIESVDVELLEKVFKEVIHTSNNSLNYKKQVSYDRVKKFYTWDKVIHQHISLFKKLNKSF